MFGRNVLYLDLISSDQLERGKKTVKRKGLLMVFRGAQGYFRFLTGNMSGEDCRTAMLCE
jgi:hypothetical protein